MVPPEPAGDGRVSLQQMHRRAQKAEGRYLREVGGADYYRTAWLRCYDASHRRNRQLLELRRLTRDNLTRIVELGKQFP